MPLTRGEPLRIGETYFFDSIGERGQLGEVTTATVNEIDKQVLFSVKAEDGHSYILSEPISDEALADYKAHPEAFFGLIQRVAGKADNVYEPFGFFVNCYKGSTKEQLLELMKDAADIEALRQMDQIDTGDRVRGKMSFCCPEPAEKPAHPNVKVTTNGRCRRGSVPRRVLAWPRLRKGN